MPDFDRLHTLARRLAQLTAPGQQESGLATWNVMVGETWQEIARMWEDDPKRAAAPAAPEIVTRQTERHASRLPELYAALESAIETIHTWHSMPHAGAMPLSEHMREAMWDLYRQTAPEMKRLTAALAKARPGAPDAQEE